MACEDPLSLLNNVEPDLRSSIDPSFAVIRTPQGRQNCSACVGNEISIEAAAIVVMAVRLLIAGLIRKTNNTLLAAASGHLPTCQHRSSLHSDQQADGPCSEWHHVGEIIRAGESRLARLSDSSITERNNITGEMEQDSCEELARLCKRAPVFHTRDDFLLWSIGKLNRR